ncbi:MAG: hypothetical protein QMD96_00395 [Anaerosomatales bacterium]|nr:hypothetical protein [Anaerosomatales bacterium]
MDVLSSETLRELASSHGGTQVSIYLPTKRFAPEAVTENGTRLKNLLKEAREQLVQRGMRAGEADALLKQASALVEDRPFWLEARDGLAVFVDGGTRTFRLPVAFEESVFVGDRFRIRPLLTAPRADERFYVLSLSLKRPRVLVGSPAGLRELAVEEMPEGLADALKWDDFEKRSLQFHTRTAQAPGGRRPAVFHGSGEPDPKEEIARYFRGIDRVLSEQLDAGTPVVLAAVDYLVPLYRAVSSLPSLAAEAVTGSPDGMSDQELHARAWDIARPALERERAAALQRAVEMWSSPRVVTDPAALVSAAADRRVETLFVAVDAELWGVWRDGRGTETHPVRLPGDEDLLDLAAAFTLRAGGAVHAVEHEHMPQREAAVALLRY